MVFPAQLVAGIAAAGVVSCLFPGPANFSTRLGGGASIAQGLFIEMFLTAQLVFVIIMLAVVKHKSTFLAPVGIGLAFFLCEMVGSSLFNSSISFYFSSLTFFHRRLFHWRILKSGTLTRPRHNQSRLSWLSLDLLGWALSWLPPRFWLLSFTLLGTMGEDQSRTGLQ